MDDSLAVATQDLVCEGVVAGYGGAPVINGISVTAAGGRILAVVGPNGAGKSTLLRALLGLIRVREGRVLLGGKDITNKPLEELSRIGVGYVPQGEDVFDTLSVSENLDMGGFILPRKQREERVDAVMEIFPALRSLTRRYGGTLSGGERKMVAFARVLMPDPTVLLLDEPTAGMSGELTSILLEQQVVMLAGLGKAVVLVEQKAEAALKVANDAVVLVGGTIVLAGSGKEILEDNRVGEIFLGKHVGGVA
ncbi:MAG TPA: ABC transporter ATP-binding protein [Acidimicrobiales bacterium]|nr:ABC transporter ATP-binding protein [Acidimicrobiales bacterium]